MIFEKVNLVYFSATGSTAGIIAEIGKNITAKEKRTYNLFSKPIDFVSFAGNEIAVFGVPVFSGRVPETARKAIEKIKGENTPAIITCVYGNRDFDDALLELKDIVEQNGFYVISAGAFIAQHSIFPKLGSGRPDKSDLEQIGRFCNETLALFPDNLAEKTIELRGDFPYRPIKAIPLFPKASTSCNLCGFCAKSCPVDAIDTLNPKNTDKAKCIACAHCIAVCPRKAKRFGGLLYWLVSQKFIRKFAERKEPYMVFRKKDVHV